MQAVLVTGARGGMGNVYRAGTGVAVSTVADAQTTENFVR